MGCGVEDPPNAKHLKKKKKKKFDMLLLFFCALCFILFSPTGGVTSEKWFLVSFVLKLHGINPNFLHHIKLFWPISMYFIQHCFCAAPQISSCEDGGPQS